MPGSNHEHIGARLREVRKRRGLSQQALASTSGVSLSLIRKLEQGERADTRLETARQLAAALHVPTTSLIADHQEEGAGLATLDRWSAGRRALVAPVGPDPKNRPPSTASAGPSTRHSPSLPPTNSAS